MDEILSTEQILAINKRFYEYYAKDFSLTRQAPWTGWNHILPDLKSYKNPKILDLGCGNGRFYGYLRQNLSNFDYLGIDSSEQLIADAINNYGKHFSVVDLMNYVPSDKYDIIASFGVMHHIPNSDLRKSLIDFVANSLNPKGIAIFTFWVHRPEQNRIVSDFGKGDYLITWSNDHDISRFVHIFNETECLNLIGKKLKLAHKFYEDGKDHKSNLYLSLQKI
jgi:tRNA (uracil-5-)-methyltransferase TRM9